MALHLQMQDHLFLHLISSCTVILPSLKTSSSLPVCPLSYHLHPSQIYKKLPTHSKAVTGPLCQIPLETVMEIWHHDSAGKSVRLPCPRLPDTKWAQVSFTLISLNLYGNSIDLANPRRQTWGFLLEIHTCNSYYFYYIASFTVLHSSRALPFLLRS